MTKTNKMMLKWEGLHDAKSLYLNMVYYHIRFSKKASNLCKTIITWGKYCYKRLPMEISNLLDIYIRK